MITAQTIMGLVKRATAPLNQRVRLMISRGAVKLVNDALKCQGLQVALLSDEVRDDVERFQEYGFTSTPFTEAEALFLSVGGNRSHGVVVCVTDRRHRPLSLNAGDVCLYTDKGERVYLERVGDIVNLGAKAADDFLAKATATKANDDAIAADIELLRTTIAAWTPVAMDGGAKLKTDLGTVGWLAGSITPSNVATTKVKGT